MSIVINTPSGDITVNKAECIGLWYLLFVPSLNRRVVAICIDADPEHNPKRMRIQRSLEHGGEVLMPHQYEIIEKDYAWED